MFLLTLPDTPIASPRGIGHLLIIGIVLILSLLLVTILAFYGKDVPDVLTLACVSGIGYLFGANTVAKKRSGTDE